MKASEQQLNYRQSRKVDWSLETAFDSFDPSLDNECILQLIFEQLLDCRSAGWFVGDDVR